MSFDIPEQSDTQEWYSRQGNLIKQKLKYNVFIYTRTTPMKTQYTDLTDQWEAR